MHTLYGYTTKSQSKRTVATIDGEVFPVRVKSGQTELTGDVRIPQQDGTSNSEPLIPIFERNDVPAHITDHVLHKALERKGYLRSRDDKNREWFDFPECETAEEAVLIIRETLNGLINGVEALEDWESFPYQQDIIDWAVERSKESDDMLLNIIMRGGKCRISYEIALKLKAKKILILTGKPGVNDSWSSLLPGGEEYHINYVGWKYHDYNNYKKSKFEFTNTGTDVAFVSLQYLNAHFDNPTKLAQQVFDTEWDIIPYDEQHYATDTINTHRIFKRLMWKKKFELGGTPYKTLLSNRYSPENIYNFDYIDEQKIRKELLLTNEDNEITKQFRYRADINFALINVPDKVKQYLGDEGFTFSKLFASEDGQFKNVMGVNEFLTVVQNNYKNPPKRFKKVADKLSRHSLWFLPGDVKAIALLEQTLKDHPFFGKRKIINASGNNVKQIQQAKNIIALDDHKGGAGTITLTCDRWKEGTTVPEWWSVHQMNDDKSASDYFQGSFRIKSVQTGKESVLVYDYAPERFVSVVYQYCELEADATGRTLNDVLSEWLDVSDVYDYTGNSFNIVTGKEITKRFLANITNHIDRVSNYIMADNIDEYIIETLRDKKKDSNQATCSTEFNSNGIEQGSNKRTISNNGSANRDSDEDDLSVTVQRIRYSLKQIFSLADVLWADDIELTQIQDIIKSDPDIVLQMTGLTISEWAIIMGTLDTIKINRALEQFDAFNIDIPVTN